MLSAKPNVPTSPYASLVSWTKSATLVIETSAQRHRSLRSLSSMTSLYCLSSLSAQSTLNLMSSLGSMSSMIAIMKWFLLCLFSIVFCVGLMFEVWIHLCSLSSSSSCLNTPYSMELARPSPFLNWKTYYLQFRAKKPTFYLQFWIRKHFSTSIFKMGNLLLISIFKLGNLLRTSSFWFRNLLPIFLLK